MISAWVFAAEQAPASDFEFYAILAGFACLLVFLLAIYALPTVLAVLRGHPDVVAICILNVLLGWTLLGWGLALAWAILPHKSDSVFENRSGRPPPV